MKNFMYLSWVMVLLLGFCFVLYAGGAGEVPSGGELRISAETWYFKKYKLLEAGDMFQKDHPNVKVTWEKVPSFDLSGVMLMFSRGKTNTDLMIQAANPDVAALVANNYLEPFGDDFFIGDFAKDKWIKVFLEEGNFGGKNYTLGTDCANMFMSVRRDWFQDAGLTNPQGKIIPAKDMDELYTYAKKLTKKDASGKTVRYGLDGNWHWDYEPWTYLSGIQATRGNIYESDGKSIDFSSPEANKFMKFWYDGIKDGIISNASITDASSERSGMKSGLNAMIWTDHARWIECGNEVGFDKVVLMPIPGAEKNGGHAYAMVLMVPRLSPNKDFAYKFIKEQFYSDWFSKWTIENYGKMFNLIRCQTQPGISHPEEWKMLMNIAERSSFAPRYDKLAMVKDMMHKEVSAMFNLKQAPEETLNHMRKELAQINPVIVK